MHLKLLTTFGVSILICLANYIAATSSNLGSTRAILIDSLIDLIFPILSLVALHFQDLDVTLSVIQFLVIIASTLYFIISKLKDTSEELERNYKTMISMIISIFLTIICIQLTASISSEKSELFSLKAVATHFQIDLISKLFVIIITILNKTSLQKSVKQNTTRLLDLSSMALIIFTASMSFYRLLKGV